VSKGTTTLLRTNKNKVITIENEQKRKKKGTTTTSDFEKMKKKVVVTITTRMNKGKRKKLAAIANEQRIEKWNNINYYRKCTKYRKEEMKMYKRLKRGAIIVVANE
jgi:hypothetical protein